YRVLHIANLIATYAAMYYKGFYKRPRPSQVCPALLPPLPLPGHASFPSGHATQAFLMTRCIRNMLDETRNPVVLTSVPLADIDVIYTDLRVLAYRIARNREIVGLHYATDTAAGRVLARDLFTWLTTDVLVGGGMVPSVPSYRQAITDAKGEWL